MDTTSTARRITVRPVLSSRDRQRFIDFQYDFYRDNPYWVPLLRMDVAKTLSPQKNPFFKHGAMQLFLAEDETGRLIGRIAAIENGMHLRKYDDGNGFFGFFECVEEYDVAEALLDTAADWLRGRGLTGMRGPTNPTMNDMAGLLVDGFDQMPFILMPYNPAYYEGFLTRYGFERAMTMWAYYVHYKYMESEKLRRGTEVVFRRNPGLTLRELRPDHFMDDVTLAMEIYNQAWANNWGHVPYTREEAEHLANDLKQIIEPDMFLFLELDGEPVAFSVTIANMNLAIQHVKDGRLFPLGLPKLLAHAKLGTIYEVRMPLMGVLPEYHGRGFHAPLIYQTIQTGVPRGYHACEMSWVLDSNQVLKNALLAMGSIVDKEYAMFQTML